MTERLHEDYITDRLFWFYKMVSQGGPDGSDLDAAVYRDATEAAEQYEHEVVKEEGGWLPEFDKPKYRNATALVEQEELRADIDEARLNEAEAE